MEEKKKNKKRKKKALGRVYRAHPQCGQVTWLAGTDLWHAGQTLKVWAPAAVTTVCVGVAAGAAVAGAPMDDGGLPDLGVGSSGSASSNLDGLFGFVMTFTQMIIRIMTKISSSTAPKAVFIIPLLS